MAKLTPVKDAPVAASGTGEKPDAGLKVLEQMYAYFSYEKLPVGHSTPYYDAA